jgi:hypothetical protein
MAQATAHPDRRLISSEDVQGTNVYGMGDEAIGEIDHLLIEKISGRVAYAVMSFGGFLGLAHSHYPIPWSALKYDTALQGYRTGITEAQLKDAPDFSDDSWTDRDWETRTHQQGALGSHLEILERNDGYKGFNQTGISQIIRRTDPRGETVGA